MLPRPQNAHKGLNYEALGGIVLIAETLGLTRMGFIPARFFRGQIAFMAARTRMGWARG
jgi:hypothetical protein